MASGRVVRLCVMVALIGVASCTPPQRIGFTIRQGDVVVIVGLCEGERVESISIETIAGYDDTARPAGEVVWKISSNEGSTETEYVIGATPESFSTEIAPPPKFSSDVPLTIDVVTSTTSMATGVPLDELEPDMIYYDGRLVSIDTFFEDVRC